MIYFILFLSFFIYYILYIIIIHKKDNDCLFKKKQLRSIIISISISVIKIIVIEYSCYIFAVCSKLQTTLLGIKYIPYPNTFFNIIKIIKLRYIDFSVY